MACEARIASDSQDLAAYRVLEGALLGFPTQRVAILRLAVRHAPLDAGLQFNLGLALRVADQLPEALTAFRRAARLAPSDAAPRTEAGLTAARLSLHAEALTFYEDALDIAPSDGYTWGFLARSLQVLGRHPEAVRAWDRAEALTPHGFIDEAGDRQAYDRSRSEAGLRR
jgi:tetratricopeptide (TPR) repeat protein